MAGLKKLELVICTVNCISLQSETAFVNGLKRNTELESARLDFHLTTENGQLLIDNF